MEEKEQVKILGVTLCNDLTWDAHTTKLIGGLKLCYKSFSRSCKLLNMDSRRLLYNAVIASRTNYCDAIWDSCSVHVKNKLQTVQNRCARRILNCLPGTSAAPLLRELGWLKLETKRKLRKCVLLHRLLHGNGPNSLIDMLQPYTYSSVNTRNASGYGLFIPRYNTNYIKKSFFTDTALIWNSLPNDIKGTASSATFKEKLHKYFFNVTLE